MKLEIKHKINHEIIHYYQDNFMITSKYNKVFVTKGMNQECIKLPYDGWKTFFSFNRIFRRLFRLDKCNVFPTKEGLIIIRMSKVYFYSYKTKKLTHTLTLQNCRNILHQSATILNGGKEIIFGEYGMNPDRKEVPIYKSEDSGKSWKKIYVFEPGRIKHIHGCYYDQFEDKIWVFTGDYKDECFIVKADKDFKNLEWIGDGSQIYRGCSTFFTKDYVYWAMDSEFEDNYLLRLNRKSKVLDKIRTFPGPIIYTKTLKDGVYLLSTVKDKGPGIKDSYAHLYASKDLKRWEEIGKWRHDGLPVRFFKSGIISFADGEQTSKDFYIFGEALIGLDGKIARCLLEKNSP